MSVRRAVMWTCAMALGWSTFGCGASPRMLHQSEAYYERCHAADLDPARSTDDRLRCWTAWVEHYREGMPPERVSHARRRITALQSGVTLEPLPDVTPTYTATFMALEAAEVESPPAREPSAGAPGGVPTSAGATVELPDGPRPAINTPEGRRPAAEGAASGASVSTSPPVESGAEPTTAVDTTPSETSPRRAPPPPRDPSRIPPRPRPLAPRASSPSHPCTPVCTPRWDACVDRAASRGIDGLEACRIEYRVCMNGCI